MTRRLIDYGESAVLLEADDLAEVVALRPIITEEFTQVIEVVPGARTLLLRLRRPLAETDRRRLLALPAVPPELDEQELTEIEVDYSGADLAEVAGLLDLSPDEVVAAHTGQVWTVAFCGFAPGFGYLIGENDRLRVPRRSNPRTAVPAGAVGLADAFSGVYPRQGPGGWQLIGQTDRPLWDLDADPPALLQPGGRVRFRAAR
ncbi:MAG TPA: allophanate hydrolase subunit 1 [Propionibacteriaceae bacterium]|nr:allophanate hydrolase subunit 1 [Propionibacteriaceae bacterium]